MAYFPNSSAGDVLEEQCIECIEKLPDTFCPVKSVQMHWNYSQEGEVEKILNVLIREDGHCAMKDSIAAFIRGSQSPEEDEILDKLKLNMWVANCKESEGSNKNKGE